MPLPVIPGHVYCQARFTRTNEDEVVNTWTFALPSGDLWGTRIASVAAALNEFYGALTPTTNRWISGRLGGLRYVMYDLGDPEAAGSEVAASVAQTPVGSPQPDLPHDACIVVSWQTDKRGPRFRGRTYLGPWSQGTCTVDGRVSTAAATQIAAAAEALINRDGAYPVVLSRQEGGQVNRITGGYVDREFDTQRRRGYRVSPRHPFSASAA